MSGHRYISNTTNLFEDEDAVDDDTFVNSYRARQPAPRQPAAPAYRSQLNDFDRQRQAMLERQREIEQRTLDSSSRSIGLLRESEDIGIATAEELAAQREKLENTNKRLDEINTNLNVSQKHLNGIKSVFYGLKNYISGKSDSTALPRSNASPNQGPSSSRPESKLEGMGLSQTDQSGYDRFNSHPSTRIRGLDEGSVAVATGTITESQRVNQMLDNNLDEMVQAISRLKDLGAGLSSEIDQQNELIDNIHDKVEGADIKIGRQNKQMNKLIGK